MNYYKILDLRKWLNGIEYLSKLKLKRETLSKVDYEKCKKSKVEIEAMKADYIDTNTEFLIETQRIANESKTLKYGWTWEQFNHEHHIFNETELKQLRQIINKDIDCRLYDINEQATRSALPESEFIRAKANEIATKPLNYIDYFTNGLPPKISGGNGFHYQDLIDEIVSVEVYQILADFKSDEQTESNIQNVYGLLDNNIVKPIDKSNAILFAYHFGLWDFIIEEIEQQTGQKQIVKARKIMAKCLGVSEKDVERYLTAWDADKSGQQNAYLNARPKMIENAKTKLKSLLNDLFNAE